MSMLPDLTKDEVLTLFRVLQESLTNLHRRSGSTRAEVRIYSRVYVRTAKLELHRLKSRTHFTELTSWLKSRPTKNYYLLRLTVCLAIHWRMARRERT